MSPPKNEYGWITKDGKQFWFVMVDESGHAYYDPDDVGPFTIGAIVTGDPIGAYDLLNSVYSKGQGKKGRNAMGEVKSIRSSDWQRESIMDSIEDAGYALVATYEPIYNQTDYSKDNGSAIYAGTLSRLLSKVAEIAPPGLYKIRIDESEYLDEPTLEMIGRAAFAGYEDKELVKHSPVRMYDSTFDPPIQVADGFIGAYRKALKRGTGDQYASRHKIIQANRKNRDILGSAASLPSKAGNMDSGDLVTGVIPYPSMSRITGKPRLSDGRLNGAIKTLQSLCSKGRCREVIPYAFLFRSMWMNRLADGSQHVGEDDVCRCDADGMGPAASSSLKTGQTDSGEVIAWEIPHPSESRTTGRPVPVHTVPGAPIRTHRPVSTVLRNHEIPFRGVASVAMEVF